MSDITAQQAVKELSHLVDAFNEALDKAKAFATEHKLSFRISPSYGMGGSFDGELAARGEDEYGEPSDGWYSSTRSCS